MCNEAITIDQEAYEYNERVFCSVECAAGEYRKDLEDAAVPEAWRSSQQYEDDLFSNIRELSVFDVATRANGLRCGDKLLPVQRTAGRRVEGTNGDFAAANHIFRESKQLPERREKSA